MLIYLFLPQVEAWVEQSEGKIRADVVHDKLLGRVTIYPAGGPELLIRTVNGDGPGAGWTVLFCAWLAWSRFRVVLPLRDKTAGVRRPGSPSALGGPRC